MIDPRVIIKANYNRTLVTVRVTAIDSPDWTEIVGSRIELSRNSTFTDIFYTNSTTHYKVRAYLENPTPNQTIYGRVTLTKNDNTTLQKTFNFVTPYPVLGTVVSENGTEYITSIRKMDTAGNLSPRNYSNRALFAGAAAYIDITADADGNMIIGNQWGTPVLVQNITKDTTAVEVPGGTRDNTTTVTVSKDDVVRVTEKSANVTFREFTANGTNPLCKGVPAHITFMPSMNRFAYEADNTLVRKHFFAFFNNNGTLTSLPEGSFDTHRIVNCYRDEGSGSGCDNMFRNFNAHGALTSLPEGSFDFSQARYLINSNTFSYFNSYGALTSLPEGSFDFDNLRYNNPNSFDYFNQNGALVSLPEGSFGFSSCMDNTYLTVGGTFEYFNSYGRLTSLPAGSFHFPKGSKENHGWQGFNNHGMLASLPEHSLNFMVSSSSGFVANAFNNFNAYGALTSLPAGSFKFDSVVVLYWNSFQNFNNHGALVSLPEGSFNTEGVRWYYSGNFQYFNYYGALTSLPEGSFRFTDSGVDMRADAFRAFNAYGALKSLPKGSFNFTTLTNVGVAFCAYFNWNGALERLPVGAFSVENVVSVNQQSATSEQPFAGFNRDGKLTKSTTYYNPNHIFPTVASAISVDAYYYDPDTQSQITETVSHGNPFYYYEADYYSVSYELSPAYTLTIEDEYLSGQTVTFMAVTIDPEDYELTPSIVTEGGATITVTDNGDNTFTFTMPKDNITLNIAVRMKPAKIVLVADETGDLMIGNKWTTPILVQNVTQGTDPVSITTNPRTLTISVNAGDEITVTESTAGATFRNWVAGYFIGFAKGVDCHITEMPPMKRFTTDAAGTTPGAGFFQRFNYNGSITALPGGSFDTSALTSSGANFFEGFNEGGKLTSLPAGSFNISNLTTAGTYFFCSFNKNGKLTSLPAGSFDTSNIQDVFGYCFDSFNNNGALTSLPEGSFNTSKMIPHVQGGNSTNFFTSFNARGKLVSLPAGSFDISQITATNGNFFAAFNSNGALTSLPAGSFDTSNITSLGTYGFNYFNSGGKLLTLPTGSFGISQLAPLTADVFSAFNDSGGNLQRDFDSYNPDFINISNDTIVARYYDPATGITTAVTIAAGDPLYYKTA